MKDCTSYLFICINDLSFLHFASFILIHDALVSVFFSNLSFLNTGRKTILLTC